MITHDYIIRVHDSCLQSEQLIPITPKQLDDHRNILWINDTIRKFLIKFVKRSFVSTYLLLNKSVVAISSTL